MSPTDTEVLEQLYTYRQRLRFYFWSRVVTILASYVSLAPIWQGKSMEWWEWGPIAIAALVGILMFLGGVKSENPSEVLPLTPAQLKMIGKE